MSRAMGWLIILWYTVLRNCIVVRLNGLTVPVEHCNSSRSTDVCTCISLLQKFTYVSRRAGAPYLAGYDMAACGRRPKGERAHVRK